MKIEKLKSFKPEKMSDNELSEAHFLVGAINHSLNSYLHVEVPQELKDALLLFKASIEFESEKRENLID